MSSLVPKTLRIGVLMPEEVQLLDVASVDLLPMLGLEYITKCGLPKEFCAKAIPEVEVYYISETAAGTHQDTSARAKIQITHSIDDDEVQPGKLDIIHIPGPFPPANTTQKFKDFVLAHEAYEHSPDGRAKLGTKTVFLVVCTGIFVAGNCGLLDGRKVTGPLPAVETLAGLYPKAQWDSENRWVRDGHVWTCGTICNGLDMIPAFMLETFPRDLVEPMLYIAQVAERPAKYEKSLNEVEFSALFSVLGS